ncbi:LapA family protein [Sporosarcina beigongshangi]|uniref:LapA family protein n=1 Tax=Sporosarcina beigongshangi TaxID=2782538 RepID=UPI0019393C92|nr:lipopolysaccharide assembly protein LapA domain-containing protein [Sporosarcina beigongshangi]
MKFQWNLLLGLLFAIIIALFAIFNIDAVQVNYIFGATELPLVLVILFSALLGAAVSGFVAMFRTVQSNHRVKELQKEITLKEQTIAAQQNEIAELQKHSISQVGELEKVIEPIKD